MRSFGVEIAKSFVLDDCWYCVTSYGSLFPVSVACNNNNSNNNNNNYYYY